MHKCTPAEQSPGDASAERHPRSQRPRECFRVLLTDDSAFFRKRIAQTISGMGYKVTEASSPHEALEAFAADPADIAVLDYEMPGQTGLELMNEIHLRWPATPVIILSGHEDLALALSTIRAGAIDFVVKERCDRSLADALARAEFFCRRERDRQMAQAASRRASTELALRAARQAGLNELLKHSLKARALDELLQPALDIILSQDVLRLESRGAIFLMEGDPPTLVMKAHRHLDSMILERCARVSLGYCLCGRCAETREIMHTTCVDARHDVDYDGMAPHGHYNVPICTEERVLGVIVCYLREGTPRRAEDVAFLEAAAETLAGALCRLEMETKLLESHQKLADAVEHLQELRDKAEEASRAKSEFLANMSHEIRTPMTAILGFTDILIEQGDIDAAPPERIEAARTIKRNGEYLLGIINDILDLSKIEAGRMVVERVTCSPCTIIAEVFSLVRVRAEAKSLQLNYEYIGDIPESIRSDPTRIRQILINLIGNAIKFTEVGGVRLITRMIRDDDAPVLQFDVLDTGIGMSPEQVARLFHPFTQADSSTTRKFGGTGLGLTISKRMAELLGGDVVVVETSRDAGTRFRLTVPTGDLTGVRMLDDPHAATRIMTHTDATTPAGTPTPSERPLEGVRILLAEDGVDNQKLIVHVLKKAGGEIEVVANGKLALEQALQAREQNNPFDVILMDMQMPVMSGYEATSELRNHGYDGPIIALTAHAMAGDREKCIDAGCNDYATKPVNRKKLIETVRHHATTSSRA